MFACVCGSVRSAFRDESVFGECGVLATFWAVS